MFNENPRLRMCIEYLSIEEFVSKSCIKGLKPNLHEWGILKENSTLEQIKDIPVRTFLIYDPKTVRSILEISELLEEACPHWQFEKVSGTGHKAPIDQEFSRFRN